MVNSYKDKRDRVSPYWNLDLVAGRSFGTARHDIWEGLHPRACNLLIVMSGRCTVRNGRQSTVLLPGSVYLLAPAESRVFERFGSWDAYWVLFPLRLPLLWPEINPGIFRIQPPRREHRIMLRNLIETVNLTTECRGEWYQLAGNLIDNVVLRGNRFAGNAPSDRRMLLAVKLLSQPENDLAMDEIAAKCGLSHSTFFSEFKRVHGLSPRQFREQARLQMAKILLKSEKLSIGEIAARTNLIDGSYLSKRFRKVFGVTPREYVRKFRESPPGPLEEKYLPHDPAR